MVRNWLKNEVCSLHQANHIFTRVQAFPLQFTTLYFTLYNIGSQVLLLLVSCMLLEDAEMEM